MLTKVAKFPNPKEIVIFLAHILMFISVRPFVHEREKIVVKHSLNEELAKLKAQRQSKKGMNTMRRSIRKTYER